MDDGPRDAGIVAPPPVLVFPFFVFAVVVRYFAGLEIFDERWIGHAVGWPVFVALTVLVGWAFRVFRRAGESPDVRHPTTSMVIAGPYRFTRNPMYVAICLGFVALALILNSYWFLIVVAPVVVVLHFAVIRKEERYMEELFGDEYRQYRQRVRRWI